MQPLRADPDAAAPVSVRDIFLAFANIGATGFGGVLPIARHVLVDRRRLMTPAEFAQLLTMCQFLPGPNIINMSILFGTHRHGWRGAAAALTGLLALPVIIILLLAMAYDRVADIPQIEAIVGGIAIVAAGLIVSVALKVVWLVRGSLSMGLLALAVFLAMIAGGLSLLLVVAVAAPLGVLIAWKGPDARS